MRVLYIDIDSLRPDHLGCYGYDRPTSPNIDRLAAKGMRFDRFYCASSPCVPSRTAFVSGRFGIRNGVTSNHSRGAQFHMPGGDGGFNRAETMPLPRQLRALGMDTIAVSNFADRHATHYFMSGFGEFISPNLKRGKETAEEVNACALRWLNQNADRDNWYLHVNYWDVHRTYNMDQSWADRFKDSPVTQAWPDEAAIHDHFENVTGMFTASGQFKNNKSPLPLMPGKVSTREEFDHLVTGYDAAVAYVDHHIGQLLAALESQGILDETIVMISADHGDAFGEHGIYSDHVCADECIHRLPLIVHWPGAVQAGSVDDAMHYNVDLSATLVDIAGGEVPSGWDGQSFAGNLRGQSSEGHDYLVWDTSLYTVQRAVRTRDHLYVRTYDNFGYESFDPVALYDMKNDRFQTTNIAKQQPELVNQCEKLMADWVAEQAAKGDAIPDPLFETLAERRS